MGFIINYFTGFARFCKPPVVILTIALLWACAIWGIWPLRHMRLWREIALFVVLGLWCAAWWRWSVIKPLPAQAIRWPVLVLVAICLLMAPFQSTDIFGYINRGWQQVAYKTNPYTTVINQLPGWSSDPVLTEHWVNNPCPYGMAFAHITRLSCSVTGLAHNKWLMAYVFKLTQFVLLITTIWVLNRVRRHIYPTAIRLPLVAYCWHPLVLIHGIANGHNDGWVALANTLAVWAMVAVPVLAPTALCLGGLVKLSPFVVLPMTLITLYRLQGWRVALASLGLAGGLTCWIAWPYWQPGIKWAQLAENAGLSHNSLHAMLTDIYQPVALASQGWLPSYHFMTGWLKGLFILTYGLLWMALVVLPLLTKKGRYLTKWTASSWLVASVLLQAGLLLWASSKFHAWYLNMLLPLLWLLPLNQRWVRALLAISVAYAMGISFLGKAHIINTLLMTLLPVVFIYWRKKPLTLKVTV